MHIICTTEGSMLNNYVGLQSSCYVSLLMYYRRQAPGGRCANDIAETEQPRFMNCYHILEMLSDGTNMTVSNVTAYCRAHCATYMLDIEERLIRDCGFPDTLV